MDILWVLRSHGHIVGPQVTWAYCGSSGHMGILWILRSHGHIVGPQVTWTYCKSSGHMGILWVLRSHGQNWILQWFSSKLKVLLTAILLCVGFVCVGACSACVSVCMVCVCVCGYVCMVCVWCGCGLCERVLCFSATQHLVITVVITVLLLSTVVKVLTTWRCASG